MNLRRYCRKSISSAGVLPCG